MDKITYEYIKIYIENFGYILLEEKYINNRTKLKMICDKGHECEICWSNFQQGRRCKICKDLKNGNRKRLSYDSVNEYIKSFNYTLISKEYKNSKEKLDILCPNGHNFKMSFECFKRGHRCSICNISKGERKIIDWLNKNNVKYIYDKPYFDDLLSLSGNPLRPDFIIEHKKIWIEYDGEFHYRKTYENDGYENFKIHDKIKDEYAIKNNWKLIRIPYWEFDKIENILDEIFK